MQEDVYTTRILQIKFYFVTKTFFKIKKNIGDLVESIYFLRFRSFSNRNRHLEQLSPYIQSLVSFNFRNIRRNL
jgi:hypothetical protein